MTTLDRLQAEPCSCPTCVHERLLQSIRKTLLPTPERVRAAREALAHALSLLDEISGGEPCECPGCLPCLYEETRDGFVLKSGDQAVFTCARKWRIGGAPKAIREKFS